MSNLSALILRFDTFLAGNQSVGDALEKASAGDTLLLAQASGGGRPSGNVGGGLRPPGSGKGPPMGKGPPGGSYRPPGKYVNPVTGKPSTKVWQPANRSKPTAKASPPDTGKQPAEQRTDINNNKTNRSRTPANDDRSIQPNPGSRRGQFTQGTSDRGEAVETPRGGSALSRLNLSSVVATLYESGSGSHTMPLVKNLIGNLVNGVGPCTTTSQEMRTQLTWTMGKDGRVSVTAQDDIGYAKAGVPVYVGTIGELVAQSRVSFDDPQDTAVRAALQTWQRTGSLPASTRRGVTPRADRGNTEDDRVQAGDLGLNGEPPKTDAGRSMRNALKNVQSSPGVLGALAGLKPGGNLGLANGSTITRGGDSERGFFVECKVFFAAGKSGRFTAEFDTKRRLLDLPHGFGASAPKVPVKQVAVSASNPKLSTTQAGQKTLNEEWEELKKIAPDTAEIIEQAAKYDGVSIAEVMRERRKGFVVSEILARLRDRGMDFGGAPPKTTRRSAVAGGFEEPTQATKDLMTQALKGHGFITADVINSARRTGVQPLALAKHLAAASVPMLTERSDEQVRSAFTSPSHWGLNKDGLFVPDEHKLAGEPKMMWQALITKFGEDLARKLFDANVRSGLPGVLNALNRSTSAASFTIDDLKGLAYLAVASSSSKKGVLAASLHDVFHAVTAYGLNEFQESQGLWFSDATADETSTLLSRPEALKANVPLSRQPGATAALRSSIREHYEAMVRGSQEPSTYVSSINAGIKHIKNIKPDASTSAQRVASSVEDSLDVGGLLTELNPSQRAKMHSLVSGLGQQHSLERIVGRFLKTKDASKYESELATWSTNAAKLLESSWQAGRMKPANFYQRATHALAFRLLVEHSAPSWIKGRQIISVEMGGKSPTPPALVRVDLRTEYPKALKEVNAAMRTSSPTKP